MPAKDCFANRSILGGYPPRDSLFFFYDVIRCVDNDVTSPSFPRLLLIYRWSSLVPIPFFQVCSIHRLPVSVSRAAEFSRFSVHADGSTQISGKNTFGVCGIIVLNLSNNLINSRVEHLLMEGLQLELWITGMLHCHLAYEVACDSILVTKYGNQSLAACSKLALWPLPYFRYAL
jgi:hypothetical protein